MYDGLGGKSASVAYHRPCMQSERYHRNRRQMLFRLVKKYSMLAIIERPFRMEKLSTKQRRKVESKLLELEEKNSWMLDAEDLSNAQV